jgi:putative SOS response-associated peptidase YedK
MCGRIVNRMQPGYLREKFDEAKAAEILEEAGLLPRFNLAPTEFLPGIRLDEKGAVTWDIFRWGLIPRWAKPDRIPDKTFNARSETVAEKPTFRDAWKTRRCILPVSGYYEWTGEPGNKQPFLFYRADGSPLILAGLWETWKHGDNVVDSCTVITRASAGRLAEYHHRMPVFLDRADVDMWLKGSESDAQTLIEHDGTDFVGIHPVSREVNNSRNDYASLIEPIATK